MPGNVLLVALVVMLVATLAACSSSESSECPGGDQCPASCGNGIMEAGETCDDGDAVSGDGCSSRCQSEVCGNMIDDPGEQCDDGNDMGGDGCSSMCMIEVCGDTMVDEGEQCDDGNNIGGDGCDPGCRREPCGDGMVDPDYEYCDDGNRQSNDGCSATCFLEYCGDGIVQTGEMCDDENALSGDGCSSSCQQEMAEDLRVVQIAAGGQHTCALLDSGAVRCFGDNSSGQLGYGYTMNIGDDEYPAAVGNVPLGGIATQITTGSSHTCALLDSGAVRCWGDNSYGQLGYGNLVNIGDDETPAAAGDVPLGGSAIQLTGGLFHTCALLDTGAVRCWGSASSGRLGYGNLVNIGDDETPAAAGDVPLGGSAIQVDAGNTHTCAVLNTGAVRCWGYGEYGVLGYGNTENIGDNETPAAAGDVPLGGPATRVTTSVHTCALLETGAVRCWGFNAFAALGYGNTEHIGDNETPASAGDVDVGGLATQIDAGTRSTCALLETGAVRCWGEGARGRLGYGNIENIGDNETPAAAGDVDVGGLAIQVTAGSGHACALLDTGAARCWGESYTGALGYGTPATIGDDETPASAGDVRIVIRAP